MFHHRAAPLLGALARQQVGEEKEPQYDEHDEKLNQDNGPQRPAEGHRAESVEVEIEDLNKDFFNFHRKLAPFGPDNMKPVLVLKNQKVAGFVKTMGKENNHLKFYIKQESTGRNIECVGFKLGKFADEFRQKKFNIAFTAEENHWKGNVTYFLNIRDVKFN